HRVTQHPRLDRAVRLVEKRDGDGLLRGGTGGAAQLDPVPKLLGVDDAALARRVSRRVNADDLADVVLQLVAVAVFGDLVFGADAGDIGKASKNLAAVETHDVVEGA